MKVVNVLITLFVIILVIVLVLILGIENPFRLKGSQGPGEKPGVRIKPKRKRSGLPNKGSPFCFQARLKMRSDQIKKGFERAPHRSLLKATGVRDEDFGKPFIAVVNSYVDIVPGHVHLLDFGRMVKEAVRAAGGVPFENISISLFLRVRSLT